MKITITGPRSVGKSTVSKLLAERLRIPYFSSDDLLDKSLSALGGLDVMIKAGKTDEIMQRALPQVEFVLEHADFVYDLAGGAVSSSTYATLAKTIIQLINRHSTVIGLLPFPDLQQSLGFLYARERQRPHFQQMDKDILRAEVEKDYKKYPALFARICDKVVYVERKSPEEIVNELSKLINS